MVKLNLAIPVNPDIGSQAKGKPAKLGDWEGNAWISDDFNAPLDDFEEYM